MKKNSMLYIYTTKEKHEPNFPVVRGFVYKGTVYKIELFLNNEHYIKNLERKFFLKYMPIEEFKIFKNAYVIPISFTPVRKGIYEVLAFINISRKIYFKTTFLLTINKFKNGIVEPNDNYWNYKLKL
jgi:hypothetical protein